MDNEPQDIAVGMDIQDYQCKIAWTLSILWRNGQYKRGQNISMYYKETAV